ncbi:MAG: DAK2 domain-containing protein, partial [Lachnospiraceae bacterium]|nr:DAK2 domain-containing protein [Lachnospiraceae bacterium]
MFISGANALDAKKEWINELNVFPVPDGDTGTNMTMTIMSAVRAVSEDPDGTLNSLTRAISSGALKGARGNSGVILSQLLRGFSKSVQEEEVLDIPAVVRACHRAVETAYKAVMAPKEGTILTVAKGLAEKAEELKEETSFENFLEKVVAYGDEVLQKTPELLPVLKQAGVVDSGGQGLMVVLHGVLDACLGREVDLSIPEFTGPSLTHVHVDTENLETSDIKFGYCTEFIILLEKEFTEEDEREFKHFLTGIGDSLVCVADDELVKIHVHTNDPGLALQKALTWGQLSRIKIDNMREEHQERLFKDAEKLAAEQKKADDEKEREKILMEEHKEVGFISVCAGDGLTELFHELGCDIVISGGQTMNPSTEDFLEAIGKINADHIFILPNNSNIILAANQAALLTEDKHVAVIPTRTVCEGITCLVNYVPQDDVKVVEETLIESRQAVSTIEVTYAIRDTVIDGVEIHKNDFMALFEKMVLSVGTDLNEVVKEAVRKAVTDDSFLVTLYYGEDITEADARQLSDFLQDVVQDAEVDVIPGGQPVYYYLISV